MKNNFIKNIIQSLYAIVVLDFSSPYFSELTKIKYAGEQKMVFISYASVNPKNQHDRPSSCLHAKMIVANPKEFKEWLGTQTPESRVPLPMPLSEAIRKITFEVKYGLRPVRDILFIAQGIDTCGQDPCVAMKELDQEAYQKKINLRVSVLGNIACPWKDYRSISFTQATTTIARNFMLQNFLKAGKNSVGVDAHGIPVYLDANGNLVYANGKALSKQQLEAKRLADAKRGAAGQALDAAAGLVDAQGRPLTGAALEEAKRLAAERLAAKQRADLEKAAKEKAEKLKNGNALTGKDGKPAALDPAKDSKKSDYKFPDNTASAVLKEKGVDLAVASIQVVDVPSGVSFTASAQGEETKDWSGDEVIEVRPGEWVVYAELSDGARAETHFTLAPNEKKLIRYYRDFSLPGTKVEIAGPSVKYIFEPGNEQNQKQPIRGIGGSTITVPPGKWKVKFESPQWAQTAPPVEIVVEIGTTFEFDPKKSWEDSVEWIKPPEDESLLVFGDGKRVLIPAKSPEIPIPKLLSWKWIELQKIPGKK